MQGLALLLIPLLAGLPSHAQRPLGTDVSHWQGASINWTAVKNAGVTFAWTKATESDYYTDDTFVAHVNGAKAAGIPIGAYHFARPSDNPNITGATSAETEAAFFWSVVSNYVKPGGAYMVPVLDWEDEDATIAAGFTVTTMSAWVNKWCNTVSNYAWGNGVVIKPVVYTGVWFSQPSSTYPGLNSSVTIWPSWISAYPTTPNPQTGGPSSSYPWSTWNFWQYATTNWSGGDSDVFNGTAAGLSAYIVGNAGLPTISSDPSDRTADWGGSLTMTTTASGTAPLRYQWRFSGTNISGATNAFLTLTNIQPGNAGDYAVVVTNVIGRTTSSVAVLTVNPLFTPVFVDNFDINSSASWTVNKSSADSRVTFAYDYSPYGIPSAPNSTNSTTKGVKFEANMTAGVTAALSISPNGQSFGGNYRLHFDMWINANGPFPAGGTGSTQHETAGLGTAGNRVQWNSGTSDGVWFAIDGEGQATDTSPDIRAYIGTTLQNTNTGIYVGGTDTQIRRNSHPYYSNVFPGGQAIPAVQAQTGALASGTVGFAWRDVVINKTGNVIDWFIDGLKIASVTNTLTASNIFVGYWDSFTSISGNTNLSFGLVDNLRVEVPAVAPNISAQPLAVAVKVTSNATFNVAASGTPAPTYQWRFNGANIVGATLANYTRTGVQYSQAGNYSVVVSNVAGSVVSSNALLTILPAAPAQFQTFALQPDNSLVLTLAGDAGATYLVETSTNLMDWTALTNVSLVLPTIQLNVGNATSDEQRYFRARSAP
ncbi:MAG: GH25 family lysozyme [Verrucomicrobiota bacterium]